eukprot:6208877-Pleurochrysis_carterae.AAC.1
MRLNALGCKTETLLLSTAGAKEGDNVRLRLDNRFAVQSNTLEVFPARRFSQGLSDASSSLPGKHV